MTPEAQRIAIALASGWHRASDGWWHPSMHPMTNIAGRMPPDYLTDLNAMHNAEAIAKREHRAGFVMVYCDELMNRYGQIWHATAAQRAEAFLRALNLWDDSK